MTDHICKTCGKSFLGPPHKLYCSVRCRRKAEFALRLQKTRMPAGTRPDLSDWDLPDLSDWDLPELPEWDLPELPEWDLPEFDPEDWSEWDI